MTNTTARLILLQVFILLFSINGNSQNFSGGVRAGLTLSEVSGDQLGGPNKPGLFAAIFANTYISEFHQLQLELLYTQKGSKSIPNEANDFYTYKFYLQYVEVPIVLIYDLQATRVNFLRWFSAESGLAFSYLVGYYEEMNSRQIDLSNEKPFNKFELNLLLGVNYHINPSLEASLRFTQGISPIRPHQGHTTLWYNRGQYNSVWSIGLTYRLF
jgi:hypothetical protein